MKKVIASVMVAVLIPCLLTGCIKKVDTAKETTKETTEQTAAAQSEKTEQTEGQAAESAAAQTEVQAAGKEAEMTAQTEAEPAAQTEAEAAEAGKSAKGSGKVVVYNWGEYIDPDVLDQFEEETGIEVVYEEFETNEIMYPKVAAGAASYDLICPSDYMIAKMIANDMLQPINFDHIPNY